VNLTQLRAYIAHPSFIKPVIVEPEEVDDTKEALTQL